MQITTQITFGLDFMIFRLCNVSFGGCVVKRKLEREIRWFLSLSSSGIGSREMVATTREFPMILGSEKILKENNDNNTFRPDDLSGLYVCLIFPDKSPSSLAFLHHNKHMLRRLVFT
ncbi:hypothetical protein SCA6_008120 [Theobroma cacao]